jgi:hypothetical protein
MSHESSNVRQQALVQLKKMLEILKMEIDIQTFDGTVTKKK